MEKKISIMLADDHALVLAGLKLLLKKRPTFHVIGEATNGHEAIELYHTLQPDILILDISMPGLNGIQVLTEIKSQHKQAKIIVLTMHEDEDYISLVMQAGASGYIPKAAFDEELYTAIDTVMAGHIYLRPEEIHSVINSMRSGTDAQNPFILLSPREREILQFLVKGFSLTETAEELMISIKTVDTHKTRIMNKLSISKKHELVEYAMKYNLMG
ncbi:response regulator [Sporosarcina highlanderae]|uniref:Response regulator transcription factor n=1 Tax=Sporosarcina highlanderae TaxID=3035916 RepID=A0ABT8JUA8_9BACL|nr:response regulator transcription factor [Sporosarcina highlanderae]MDN4608146.1 response regulator transcription factor [Sporosarcina highlanderae]